MSLYPDRFHPCRALTTGSDPCRGILHQCNILSMLLILLVSKVMLSTGSVSSHGGGRYQGEMYRSEALGFRRVSMALSQTILHAACEQFDWTRYRFPILQL